MKIGAYSSLPGVRAVDRPRGTPRTGAGQARRETSVDTPRAVEIGDFFGVPDSELTPKVREALTGLMEEVDSLRQELQVARGRISDLEELADKDPLMPVANRRAFVREMSRMMSYTERYGVPSSLVFFDVNGLKEINDSMGHAAGDKALLAVATALGDNVRETDIVGRIGGDEFGVILAQADEDVAREKALQLVEAIRAQPVEIDGRVMHVDVAHGVFPFGRGDDASTALAEADRRMYRRKQQMKDERSPPDLPRAVNE